MALSVNEKQTGPSSSMKLLSPMSNVKNLRLDPARALDPVRKKLTTTEAERVMSVFNDALNRVEIVTLLPLIIRELERFQVSLGSEPVELLRHHSVVIESYEEIQEEIDILLQRRRHTLRKSRTSKKDSEKVLVMGSDEQVDNRDEKDNQDGDEEKPYDAQSTVLTPEYAQSVAEQSSDSRLKAALGNLSLVAQQMSHSTRNILRAFFVNPAIPIFIKGEISQRFRECQVLLRYLRDLRDILMHKLLTTPEEEEERMAYLTEIAKRERQHAVVIERLEVDLQERIDLKQEEIGKKNDLIRRLQCELHQIEKFSEEQVRRVRADAEKQETADENNSEAKCQKLQTETAQFRIKLHSIITQHSANERMMRQKKFQIETEVESWINKYDVELGALQEEYEEIDAIYKDEKKQLNELEERFNILEKEYSGILGERRLSRERKQKADRIHAAMDSSAATVQAAWRSYKVRKMLNQRKKKKGKQ